MRTVASIGRFCPLLGRVWLRTPAVGPRRSSQSAARRHTAPVSQPKAAALLVGEHVLVVWHRIDVQARFIGVGTRHALWRRSGRRVVPGAQVAQNPFHDPQVINQSCQRPRRKLFFSKGRFLGTSSSSRNKMDLRASAGWAPLLTKAGGILEIGLARGCGGPTRWWDSAARRPETRARLRRASGAWRGQPLDLSGL